MIMNPIRLIPLPIRRALPALVLLGILACTAVAAEPEFEQILATRRVQTVLEQDGLVFTGLDGGGVLLWDTDGAVVDQWVAGPQLTGNDVRALAWSGRHLWVAALGAGLTRVEDPAGDPGFRQFATNIAGLNVVAVTGRLVGNSERVFYGTAGDGLGLITDGLSSAVYTSEQDGLISNTVNDVHFLGDDLFIATPAGVSRFANNVFTDENTGLSELAVRDLDLDADGNLVAGGMGGVFRWDAGAGTWSRVSGMTGNVMRIATFEGSLFALDVAGNVHEEVDGAWTERSHDEYDCSALAGGTGLWIGGGRRIATGNGFLYHAYLGRLTDQDDFDIHASYASQVYNGMGVTFGPDDLPVLGDFRGLYVSWPEGDDWVNVFETPHAGNDTLTLHPGRGNVLAMTTGADGTVYAGQFAGGGVLKIDTSARRSEVMDAGNSGLNGPLVIGLGAHPAGPVFVLHEASDPAPVDILVDPGNWDDPGAWLTLTGDEGLGAGNSVTDVLVERRDVIWFSVFGLGLVRWDVNGDAAGPDDPLTWFDTGDDRWDAPVSTFLPGTNLDPGECTSLALGEDGSLWAGGDGLVQFTYDTVDRSVEVGHVLAEKRSSSGVGLVDGGVVDLAVARDGLWVVTRTGVNRVVEVDEDEVEVDSWIDLRNYLGNGDYQAIYSPSVIAPLPGMIYQKIAVNDDGSRLLLGSDQGVALVAVGAAGGGNGTGGVDPLDAVFCYPNPWKPGQNSGGLRIGGLPAGVDGSAPVTAFLYNLEGQPVWRGTHTSGEDWVFWDGKNRQGEYVQTGLYVLKVSWGGSHTVRTLALVR